jgi:hypothetical protein
MAAVLLWINARLEEMGPSRMQDDAAEVNKEATTLNRFFRKPRNRFHALFLNLWFSLSMQVERSSSCSNIP